MTERFGNWIQTFSGLAFWPLDPRAEEVCDEDIAHALSMQCRFGGHCLAFYSVAEHSVRVSQIVPPRDALAGLLHDAAEAYLIDLPRPVKLSMPDYSGIEKSIAAVIGERYGIDLVNLPLSVRAADEILLATEKRDLMSPSPREWAWLPDPLPEMIVPWGPALAREIFLRRLNELAGDGRETLPSNPVPEAESAAE